MIDLFAGCRWIQLAVSATLLLFSAGCEHITEFDSSATSSVTVFSSDLEIVASLAEIENAMQMQIYPGLIFVVTTDGEIRKYNSETLELLDTNIIGTPSAAGYSQLCFSPGESSIYVVGSLGRIIEVDLPECTVADEFSICQFPTALSVSLGNPNILYAADGVTNRLFALRASTNSLLGSEELEWGINCIGATDTDSALVGTDEFLYIASNPHGGSMRITHSIGGEFHNLQYCQAQDRYAVVCAGNFRVINRVLDPNTGFYIYVFSDSFEIPGSFHFLAYDGERYVYLLSYLGESVSRIMKYDMDFGEYVTEGTLSGVPRAIQASGSGVVYVLAVEGS